MGLTRSTPVKDLNYDVSLLRHNVPLRHNWCLLRHGDRLLEIPASYIQFFVEYLNWKHRIMSQTDGNNPSSGQEHISDNEKDYNLRKRSRKRKKSKDAKTPDGNASKQKGSRRSSIENNSQELLIDPPQNTTDESDESLVRKKKSGNRKKFTTERVVIKAKSKSRSRSRSKDKKDSSSSETSSSGKAIQNKVLNEREETTEISDKDKDSQTEKNVAFPIETVTEVANLNNHEQQAEFTVDEIANALSKVTKTKAKVAETQTTPRNKSINRDLYLGFSLDSDVEEMVDRHRSRERDRTSSTSSSSSSSSGATGSSTDEEIERLIRKKKMKKRNKYKPKKRKYKRSRSRSKSRSKSHKKKRKYDLESHPDFQHILQKKLQELRRQDEPDRNRRDASSTREGGKKDVITKTNVAASPLIKSPSEATIYAPAVKRALDMTDLLTSADKRRTEDVRKIISNFLLQMN